MEEITPRIPQLDFSAGFDRHWNGGDAASTHVFNTLSLHFPQMERFFINVATEVAAKTDLSGCPELARAVRGFIRQEAIHSGQHYPYNAVLAAQGFENVIHDFWDRLEKFGYRHASALTRIAVVCAYEHYTAIIGHWLLHKPHMVAAAPRDLALIWQWHAAEETEHKAVCYDLYHAAGGGWLRRVGVFATVTVSFSISFLWLYLNMLWRDGCLRPRRLPITLRQAGRVFLGRDGIVWPIARHVLSYLSPRYHPWRHMDDQQPLRQWLAAHRTYLTDLALERKTGRA